VARGSLGLGGSSGHKGKYIKVTNGKTGEKPGLRDEVAWRLRGSWGCLVALAGVPFCQTQDWLRRAIRSLAVVTIWPVWRWVWSAT